MDHSSPFEILDYRNKNGHGWIFYKNDGILRSLPQDKTPEDDMKIIRDVQNLELRDDDVMITAYPKCGTHWLWEIVTMVLCGRAEYSTYKKEIAMLGMPKFGKAESLPSPRVLNSHLYYRHLPRKLEEKKIKTFHIMRNPKDVSVSFFHHELGLKSPAGFAGTYSKMVDLFLEGKARWGSFFDYIKDWQEVERDHPQLPILNLYYEDLRKAPMKTIQNVANFLDKPISDRLCKEIIEACDFTRLREADQVLKGDCLKGAWSAIWKDGHTPIYRKGEIGDWKNWLTVAQNEEFDAVIQRELEGTGIEFISFLTNQNPEHAKVMVEFGLTFGEIPCCEADVK